MVQFASPASVSDALELLAADDWRVLAGGSDFYPMLGEAPLRENVVDISRLDELKGVEQEQGYWRFGALTTWSDIANLTLPSAFDGLRQAAREVGARQIQNVGTIAGNLCNASPAADGVPPLLTLNAEVELASKLGIRRLPLADFIRGYRQTALADDELVTAILVPRLAEDGQGHFLKLGSRRYMVISIVMVAAMIKKSQSGIIQSARIAVGACSAVAQRLTELERDLVGEQASSTLAELVRKDHLSELSPIDDSRATGRYRLEVAEKLVRQIVLECAKSE